MPDKTLQHGISVRAGEISDVPRMLLIPDFLGVCVFQCFIAVLMAAYVALCG